MSENEYSLLWSTGTSGDGASTYDTTKTRTLWASMFANGVFKGYLNNLAVSGATSPISIATGAAIIQGMPYYNIGDAVSKTIDTPSVGTTGFRVVVRVDWSGMAASEVTPPLYPATTQYTTRVVVIRNADGTAAIPAATTSDATAYDLTLATGTITTAGVIALTDARTYAAARGETATAGIADSAVTAAKIANRTRSFFVPASAWGKVDSVNYGGLDLNHINGFLMCWYSGIFTGFGQFQVPLDFVSGITVGVVLNSAGDINPGNNIRAKMDIECATDGEASNTHTTTVAEATIPITNYFQQVVQSTAITGAAAGDFVMVKWTRDSDDPIDDCDGKFVYFKGFVVSYTADS